MAEPCDPLHAAKLDRPQDQPLGRVSLEAGMAVIRLPLDQIHGLRVSLEPCPCRATKSTATADIRQRLSASLGRLESLRRVRPPGAAAS